MKIKTNQLSKLAISEKAAKATETCQPNKFITLYRGTTSTRAQKYVEETDTSKLILTNNPGQFHSYGAIAAYLTRDREPAEYYAAESSKRSPPEPGTILVFKIPAHCFHGAWVREEACDL